MASDSISEGTDSIFAPKPTILPEYYFYFFQFLRKPQEYYIELQWHLVPYPSGFTDYKSFLSYLTAVLSFNKYKPEACCNYSQCMTELGEYIRDFLHGIAYQRNA
jgi:hypothetical protein